MKALIQRVTKGSVSIDGKTISEIKNGFVILLGVYDGDTEKESKLLAEKTANLRVMSDGNDKMNLSIIDVKGEVLVVSQFTLCADCSGGRRPSFINAAKPDIAKNLYQLYVTELIRLGVAKVVTGEFGAYMKVDIENDGPVTILLDTKELIK